MKTQNSNHILGLEKYFEDILPHTAKDVHVHDVHRLKDQGATSLVYSFYLTYLSKGLKQQKEFVLKFYKHISEKSVLVFSLLKTLKEYNIPVPNAYYFEADSRTLGKPFIIMEKIIGKNARHFLNDDLNAQIIVDKMAETLARVHKLDINHLQNSKILRKQYELRKQRLLKIWFFIKKRCPNFLGFCPLRERRFVTAVKQLEEVKLRKHRHTLLHMDYEPDHVLVSNDNFIIVDWRDASIGDPAFDVAWTYHKLRLGRERAKVDLGEYFVMSYEKYLGRRLVNLEFWKDMVAIELALFFHLTPFKARSDLLNYMKLVDLFFGDIIGKILGIQSMQKLRDMMKDHHWEIWSKIEYIQDYVIQYLESGRCNQN
jgi:aminoglycoside phosphotransferase (APT) family kinase protein